MPTRRTLLVACAAGIAGCGQIDRTTETVQAPPPTASAWYTHPQPTGNRTVSGSADLQGVEPVEFAPDGQPQWLVARPAETGSRWTVATDDGRVAEWHVTDGSATRAREFAGIPHETQPVVRAGPAGTGLLDPPGNTGTHASPVVTPRSDGGPSKLLFVAEDGDLVVAGSETARLPVDAPPDCRLAEVGGGRYALFGDRTDRYRHGALGDTVEGETLYVVDADAAEISAETTLPAPAVFEGLQPLVADLDGDGEPEIVATVADERDGARVAAFAPDGSRLATGPIHEPGWRHQLAVAPFDPGGRPELAVVRQPHAERLLEFYGFRDGSLDVVATAEGFSSHTYGSRILSGAVAGVLGGGTTELLVPNAARDALVAVRRTQDGTALDWRLPLDGRLASNVTGVGLADGGVAVGAATSWTVRVWQS